MKKMKKIIALLVVLTVVLSLFSCCSSDDGNITKLSFKAASGYDYLKTLNGKQVTISGYMATSSPVDGSFIFLMNLPYQSCPFCVPNTSQLSNTMEIYPKAGNKFSYTNQAVKVTGTLVVADEDKPFSDMYGYEFNYKIVDADYTIIKADELSSEVALWQKIADSGVINDVYNMYEYLNFLCSWDKYYVNSYVNEKGENVVGYYLYALDAKKFIYTDGAQYNYGYKDGYFDDIVKKIEKVDATAFADLVSNVKRAKELAERALDELEKGNYTCEYKYVETFDTMDYVYCLINGEQLMNDMQTLYSEFANWLGSWEM